MPRHYATAFPPQGRRRFRYDATSGGMPSIKSPPLSPAAPKQKHRPGESKTVNGVTYTLNENSRWELSSHDDPEQAHAAQAPAPELSHEQRHAAASKALGDIAPEIGGVIRAFHESPEYKQGGDVSTTKLHPALVKKTYDWLKANVGKSAGIGPGGGHVVDMGGGKLGFASPAGAFIMEANGQARYTTKTKLVQSGAGGVPSAPSASPAPAVQPESEPIEPDNSAADPVDLPEEQAPDSHGSIKANLDAAQAAMLDAHQSDADDDTMAQHEATVAGWLHAEKKARPLAVGGTEAETMARLGAKPGGPTREELTKRTEQEADPRPLFDETDEGDPEVRKPAKPKAALAQTLADAEVAKKSEPPAKPIAAITKQLAAKKKAESAKKAESDKQAAGAKKVKKVFRDRSQAFSAMGMTPEGGGSPRMAPQDDSIPFEKRRADGLIRYVRWREQWLVRYAKQIKAMAGQKSLFHEEDHPREEKGTPHGGEFVHKEEAAQPEKAPEKESSQKPETPVDKVSDISDNQSVGQENTSTKGTKMANPKVATNLPAKSPSKSQVVSAAAMKERVQAKFVPRDPKEGEQMLWLTRPQNTGGTGTFVEYAVGDLIPVTPSFDESLVPPGFIFDRLRGIAPPKPASRLPEWKVDKTLSPDELRAAARAHLDAEKAELAPWEEDKARIEANAPAERSVAADWWEEHGESHKAAILRGEQIHMVVTAAKPGFTRSGEGWKKWEQVVVARPATEADHEATAKQKAEAEGKRIMQDAMDR